MIRRVFLSMAVCLAWLTSLGQSSEGMLHLFADEIKTMGSSEVYNFLERYLYEVSQSKRGYDFFQKMADDKVMVREGSFSNISKLSPAIPFTMTRYEDKGYDVCWTDTTGNVLLSMQFPIQFELLLGKKKDQLEEEFKEDLTAYPIEFIPVTPDSTLASVKDEPGVLQPASTAHYYLKSLNTATYFEQQDGQLKPIYRANSKWHSAANLFQGAIENADSYTFHIEQILYGFRSQAMTIRLSQWLNYCKEQRLTVYFGIEEERHDGLKALLIAQNRDLGYNHMLSIILPDNFVEKRDSVLKATANTYIRTDNVKELYSDKTIKEKKK